MPLHRRGVTTLSKNLSPPSFSTSTSPFPRRHLLSCQGQFNMRLTHPLNSKRTNAPPVFSGVIHSPRSTAPWSGSVPYKDRPRITRGTENSVYGRAWSRHWLSQTHNTLPLRPSVATFLLSAKIHSFLTAVSKTCLFLISWFARELLIRCFGGS